MSTFTYEQLRPEQLHDYQRVAAQHIIDHPHSKLWLDMGLGKTVSTLTAILELKDRMETWGTLVAAPLRVCQSVWRQEARKWSHTSGLKFSSIIGKLEDRRRALFTRADIYLINYENLEWLVGELNGRWLSKGRYLPFNTVVYDEVSKLKNARLQQGTKRGMAAVSMLPYVHRRIGLTATPASNGLLDLFGQYLVVDSGQRLGTSFEKFKSEYFYQDDFSGYRYKPFPGAEERIRDQVADITISMSNEDYLDLPPMILNDIELDLPPAKRIQYERMEKEFLLQFDSGAELELPNAASLVNRCLQFANGACYLAPGSRKWEEIHKLKLDALEDVIEEAAGRPVLVLNEFQHDAERIMKRFKGAVRISAQLREAAFLQVEADWNAGKIPILIGHPDSIGHGLNIQAGSNVLCWFGLNWSLDLYAQAIARLRRQGQKLPVIVNRILMRDTLDEAQRIALAMKAADEGAIRGAIAQYRQGVRVKQSQLHGQFDLAV